MEYKVGDKVICKENFQTFDSKIFRFLRNKSYFITDIYITYGDCEAGFMLVLGTKLGTMVKNILIKNYIIFLYILIELKI